MSKNSNYIVRDRDSGGKYLVRRANGRTYRWAKRTANTAEVLSYNAARKASYNYGGKVVAV